MNNSSRFDRARGHGIAIKRHREVRTQELDIIPADPSNAGDPDAIAIEDRDNADFRATQLLCTLSDDIKHWCYIAWRSANDTKYVGGRGLLLQRLSQVASSLAQFVQQSRVLNGDDSLRSEVLHEFYLPVGERSHFPAVDNNRTNQHVFLEHRYGKKGPRARLLDGHHAQRLTFSVSGIRFQIRDMGDLLCTRESPQTRVRAWEYRGVLLPVLAVRWRNIVEMRSGKAFTVIKQKMTEFRLANAQCVRKDGLEYGLHVTRR